MKTLEEHLREMIKEMKVKNLREDTLLGVYMGFKLKITVEDYPEPNFVAILPKELIPNNPQ